MDALLHDVRSAVRSLKKDRGFTAVAILVLALGIGINTALFSLTNALFFRELPVDHPEELVYLYDVDRYGRMRPTLDPDAFPYFREQSNIFESFTARWRMPLRLTAGDQTELTQGELVLPNYFDLLGVKARLGRTLRPDDDDRIDSVRPIVISNALWERRFDSDPAVVGRRVRLCCRSPSSRQALEPEGELEIVGVMPPEFKGTSGAFSPIEFWIPATWTGGNRTAFGVGPIVRVAAGVSTEHARTAIRQMGELFLRDAGSTVSAEVREAWMGRYIDALAAGDVFDPYQPVDTTIQRQAAALTVVVALVLLIAASNVAGLLTARGANRTGETAIRLVLGASRWRVLRLLISESMLLALGGGVFGLVLASWLLRLFHTYAPTRFAVDTPMDVRVLLATLAGCLIVGVLTGLAPALRAWKVDLLAMLPGLAVSRSKYVRARLRHVVLIPQVALALSLLTIAGFHVRSLLDLETADLGYETDGRIALRVQVTPLASDWTAGGRERRAFRSRAFYRQLVQQMDGVSGASSVAIVNRLPLTAVVDDSEVVLAQDAYTAGDRTGVAASQAVVSPRYFETMRIRLLAGRDFDERDVRLEGPSGTLVPGGLVAIVSRSLARQLWKDANPIGRSLTLKSTWPGNAGQPPDWMRVIGIVDEIHPLLNGELEIPTIYIAMGQQWDVYPDQIVAHAPGGADRAIAGLKRAATGAVLAQVSETQTLRQIAGEMLFQTRMLTGILFLAGALGLLLASVGLYGVISYSLAQRVREIGLRTALGASRAAVVGLVMKEGATVVGIGMAAGALLTYFGLRAGVNTPLATRVDPGMLILVPATLIVVVLAACYVPARRAASVDPLESLRAL